SQPKKQLKRMSNTRAVLSTIGAVAVLAIIAIPVFSMRLGIPDGSAEAPDTAEYQAYAAQAEHFGAGTNAPIVGVADIPADLSEEELLDNTAKPAEQIPALDNVANVKPIVESEAVAITTCHIIPGHDSNDDY